MIAMFLPMDVVRANPDLPWMRRVLSKNPEFTVEDLSLELPHAIGDWDYSNLVAHLPLEYITAHQDLFDLEDVVQYHDVDIDYVLSYPGKHDWANIARFLSPSQAVALAKIAKIRYMSRKITTEEELNTYTGSRDHLARLNTVYLPIDIVRKYVHVSDAAGIFRTNVNPGISSIDVQLAMPYVEMRERREIMYNVTALILLDELEDLASLLR